MYKKSSAFWKVDDIYIKRYDMTDRDFVRAEMEGRLRLIYALQMEEPDSMVISMPLSHHYDLQWRHPDGTRQYIEVKDRKTASTAYPDVMFNSPKMEYNKEWGDNFYFVSTYTDKKAIWFQPTEMPPSGITERDVWVKTTTIDPRAPKKKQKRLFLNLNDLDKRTDIPYIQINDDYDQQRDS